MHYRWTEVSMVRSVDCCAMVNEIYILPAALTAVWKLSKIDDWQCTRHAVPPCPLAAPKRFLYVYHCTAAVLLYNVTGGKQGADPFSTITFRGVVIRRCFAAKLINTPVVCIFFIRYIMSRQVCTTLVVSNVVCSFACRFRKEKPLLLRSGFTPIGSERKLKPMDAW